MSDLHLPSRRSRVALSIAVAVLLIGGGGAVWLREAPTAVTVDDAISEFRKDRPTANAGSDVALPATPGTREDSQSVAVSTTAPASGTPLPAQVPGSQGEQPAAAGIGASQRPAAGVYTFATSGGGETDALGGARHDYPEETPLTVRHTECGYTVRWQPLQERWDEWDFCSPVGSRRMNSLTTFHEFFKRPLRQQFDCGATEMFPPDHRSGYAWEWSCRSSNSTVEATSTVIGIEGLDIGGEVVDAIHIRHDAVFHGANEGSQVFEWWLHVETGLPIHMKRSVKTNSESPFGRVNYREDFVSTAMSMTPRT